jgi:hypothetical protein
MILIRVNIKIVLITIPCLAQPALQASGLSHHSSRWARFALVVGPGLVVMLADTDAGSIMTAAQSGAQ